MKIEEENLSPREMFITIQRYEALVETITAANNTLVAKLAECPGTSNDHVMILNDWCGFINALHLAHEMELERSLSAVN